MQDGKDKIYIERDIDKRQLNKLINVEREDLGLKFKEGF